MAQIQDTSITGSLNVSVNVAAATFSGNGSSITSLNANNVSSGTLAVARGGTGQTTYTNGQLLIGNTTGNTLSKATLTAGTGISITNGAGSITVGTNLQTTNNTFTGINSFQSTSNTFTGSFSGSFFGDASGLINIPVPSLQSLDVENDGSGDAPPFSYDGSANKILSYNSVGAPGLDANNTFTGNNTFNNYVTIQSHHFGNGVSVNSSTFNLGVGTNVLASVTTTAATYNTAIGYEALNDLTTGTGNTVIGFRAADVATTMTNSVIIGYDAGGSNFNSSTSVAIGVQAASYGTGQNNNFLGYQAGQGSVSSTGQANVGIGTNALGLYTTGEGNVAVGFQALYNTSTGNNNVAVGYGAKRQNTTGWYNLSFGYQAGYFGSSAWYNIAIGTEALWTNSTGYDHIAIGRQALYNCTAFNAPSVAVGLFALRAQTTSGNNLAIGSYSSYNTNTTFNLSIGHNSSYANTTGYRNVSVGHYANYYPTGGDNNVAVGYYAHNGASSGATTPYRNIAIGTETLDGITTGWGNIAIGYQALNTLSTGQNNVVVGYTAGTGLTTGIYNAFYGRGAGSSVSTGNYNTIIGGYAGTAAMSNTTVLSDGAGNVRLYIDSNGYAGFQTTAPGWAIEVDETRATNPSAYFKNADANGYGLYIAAGAQDGTSKRLIRFQDNALTAIGDITHTNGAITYGAFTGNHPAIVPDYNNNSYKYGTIVKVDSTQLLNNTQQPLFIVSKTTQAKQKSAFGVYAAKDEEDNYHIIFALGDGHILVNAEGGDIEIGDYICSSNTSGVGMKQDDDLLHSYTVAKAAENVVWANESENTKLIICTYHSA